MLDTAIGIVGIAITAIFGLASFANVRLPPAVVYSGVGVGILVIGIAIGLVAGPTTQSCTEAQWTELARKADWLPRNQCPAYPASITIRSPGGGSLVSVGGLNGDVMADLVIETSRPLPGKTVVGLIANQEGKPNFYLIFPAFSVNNLRTIFRQSPSFELPLFPDNGSQLNLWAIFVDDRLKFGSRYGSLEQIKDSEPGMTISPKVSVNINRL